MTIGDKMREIRESKGMTLEEVAAGAGLTRQRIWTLERSGDTAVQLNTLVLVAKGLHCTVYDIVNEPLGVEKSEESPKMCNNAGFCPFFKETNKSH